MAAATVLPPPSTIDNHYPLPQQPQSPVFCRDDTLITVTSLVDIPLDNDEPVVAVVSSNYNPLRS